MAKKRRAVRRNVKVPIKQTSPTKAEHFLGFAGGLIVLIAVMVALIGQQASLTWLILSLLAGIFILGLTWHTTKRPRVSAIFLLVLSIAALVMPPNGFVIGPLLGIIGAIIVLAKLKR